MVDLRTRAVDAEHGALPSGSEERFAGYGVMGLPFSSGHVLAMRRFPASSIGPAYTSVWHRDPGGRWSFWQDRPDEQACPRYFSAALAESRQVEVEVAWPGPTTLQVAVPEVGLAWTATMEATPVTRALNAVGSLMPDRLWRSPAVLGVLGPAAGMALRAGRVGMAGRSPNGHRFVANPLAVWLVAETSAQLGDVDLGPMGPLPQQAALGDFWIPQRGVFALGRAFFEPAGA